MPIYDLALPDGRTLTLEAPDESSALNGAKEWFAANPKPNVSAVEDVTKGGGVGVAQGLINLGTLPRTMLDAGYGAGKWVSGQLGLRDPNAPVTAGPLGSLLQKFAGPSAQEVKSGVESVTGEFYKPQTTAGQYAETIGEFVPGAVAGPAQAGRTVAGNLLRNAVRYGAIPGAASETAGQATKGTWMEPYARGAAGLATGGVLALRDRPVITPEMNVGNNVSPTLGIPLSRGQANRALDDQMLEQAALRGGYGPRSQQAAQDFFEQQRTATEAARGRIGQGFDRFGANIVDNPQAAAELTGETVRNVERQARQRFRQQYDEAFSAPGEFHAAAFEGIGQRIKGRLTLGRDPVIIDDVTTPLASRALQDVDDQISRLRVQNRADPFGAPNPENVVGINLQGVDQTRKRLIQFAQSAERGSADRRAVGRVISEFDNEVENAISQGLFTGDDRVLDAIRNARREYAQYRQTFRSQGAGDDVGRAMERIVGRDGGEGATATEVARYLYGESRVGASGLSVRLAQRLRNVVGPDSPEWTGIRQGLFQHLTHATPGATDWGPQKVAQRITEFLNGSGRPMSQVLFSEAERREMARFAQALREQVPLPGAVNHSNTATTLSRIAANSFDAIMGMLGFMSGGVAGASAALASRIGRQFLHGAYNDRRVMRTLYPPSDRPVPVYGGQAEAQGRTAAVGGLSTMSASGAQPQIPTSVAEDRQQQDRRQRELPTRSRIAVNPKTGDVIYYDPDAGTWVPAQVAVNPKTNERVAFDGQSWVPIPKQKRRAAVGATSIQGVR